MNRIESVNNPKIKAWAKLSRKKERDRAGLFLAEGEHLVKEALTAGIAAFILHDGSVSFDSDLEIETTPAVLARLSSSVSGTNALAICRITEKPVLKKEKLLLLDGVQDPGNLGTLIRTAQSFGYDAVYCSRKTCDFYNDKVIRSTQGALFHMPMIRTDLLTLSASLQKEGIPVIATTLRKACPLKKLEAFERHALILGNEGSGVAPELQALADARVRIEMDGFESLNVAVAGGIMMYELSCRNGM